MARWQRMPQGLIPMLYIAISLVASVTLPELEEAYLGRYLHLVSASAAIAFFPPSARE